MIAAGLESDVTDSDCDIIVHDAKSDNSEFIAIPPPPPSTDHVSTGEKVFQNGTLPNVYPSTSKSQKSNNSCNKYQKSRSRMVMNRGQPLDDLRYAIMQGNLDVTKSIIEGGISVDVILKAGWTGLMFACSAGASEIVKYLLEQNADPNYHKDMFTPLMAVCASNKNEDDLLKCCCYLLEHGARVDVHERHFTTPLMFAAREGHLQIIKELLKHNLNINSQDNQGRTALAWAASCGNGQIVRLLLNSGADPNEIDRFGQSAAELAYNQGFKEIAMVLEKNILQSEKKENCVLEKSSINKLQLVSVKRSDFKTVEEALKTKPLPQASKAVYKHGELELFLTGLQLSELVPVFQNHQLNFNDLLIMNEEDLEKIGIEQVGVRKKILEATKEVHKKEWRNSSLPNLKQCQYISCPDAVAMMANIAKHLKYISSTVVYVRQQIQSQPRILEIAQDSANVHDLLDEIEDNLKNVNNLYDELRFFKLHLDKVQNNVKYIPADIIVETVPANCRSTKRHFVIGFAIISLALGGILWKKPEAILNAGSTVLSKLPLVNTVVNC